MSIIRPFQKADIFGNLPKTPFPSDAGRPGARPAPRPPREGGGPASSVPDLPLPPLQPATADRGAFPTRGLAAPDRYEILSEIARGGMGELFLARDRVIGREVALKVLKADYLGPQAEARFLREARINGQLQHPGIVPVYDVGRLPDGRPFMAMLLVHGATLESALAARPGLDSRRAFWVHVFEQVCHAVAYAHAKGVIHRDLKPHNVILSGFGQVRVLDWGLAKVLEEDAPDVIEVRQAVHSDSVRMTAQGLTGRGAPVGTPGYMSPEQARGEHGRIDPRSDVFGLGAILSVILTGRPPFDDPDVVQMWRLNLLGDVRGGFARLDRCGAPPLLVALTKWCLAPDPAERPRDARELVGVLAEYRAVSSGMWPAWVVRAAAGGKPWGLKTWRLRAAVAATVAAFASGTILGSLLLR